MSSDIQAMGGGVPHPSKPRKHYWQRMGGKFLVFSILFHVLFLTGAAYYIIQIVSPKKLTFRAGAPSVNPVKELAEHKMSMAKKRKSMSAPAPAKRVVSQNAFTKIVLPTMPEMPTDVVTPSQIIGIGGVGIGFGSGQGGNGDGGGGGNGYMSPFGTTNNRPGTLVGTFYDLKFLRNGQPAPDVNKNYAEDITRFVQGGWHESVLAKYLKGPTKLYTSQIFFPIINTNDGPRAFKSPKPDSPGKWVVVYKGTVSPPDSGTYHFVAAGDDDMIIRFDNQTVLFNCEHVPAPEGDLTNVRGTRTLGVAPMYDYGQPLTFARSLPLNLDASKSYSIEILIGDDIPQKTWAKVLWEKEGVNYQMAGNSPILPIFGLDKISVAPETEGVPALPHLDGPLWKGGKASNSLMDMFDDEDQ